MNYYKMNYWKNKKSILYTNILLFFKFKTIIFIADFIYGRFYLWPILFI